MPGSNPLHGITGVCAIHYKNKSHPPDVPAHYYIVIPSPDDRRIVICHITSQIGKRTDYHERNDPRCVDCMVGIDKSILPALTDEAGSVVECNEAKLTSQQAVVNSAERYPPLTIVPNRFDTEFIEDIKKAILQSPVVKPPTKKAVKEWLP